jgi:pimeloyl-ACP methyl ester carboxylesterase
MPVVDSVTSNARSIKLHDERMLGYEEYGIPDGQPVLYFHGYPGARVEARFLAVAAAKAGIRLIGTDRPGMGFSSYKPGRRLLDWPGDVTELADQLHLDGFAVVGFSGGGPYAVACAYKLPQRVTSCGIVAGAGMTGRYHYFLSRWMPWLMSPLMGRLFRDAAQSRKTLLRMSQNWIEPDRLSLSPEIAELMAASLTEAFRQGARGAAQEGTILGAPWGFKVEDVRFPDMHLWHGALDREVPIAMGQAVAARLVGTKPVYYPGDGHISLIVNHSEEIMSALSNGDGH